MSHIWAFTGMGSAVSVEVISLRELLGAPWNITVEPEWLAVCLGAASWRYQLHGRVRA